MRSLGGAGVRSGRLGRDPSRLCRHQSVVLVSGVRGDVDLLQGSTGHPLGLARNLQRLGVRPEKLVWDRESAIAGRGKPTEAFLGFCGQLSVGWIILAPADPQAKGQLERQHDYLEKNFEPRRSFVNHHDFSDQLDSWSEKANGRQHRTTRAVPADRLAHERGLSPLVRRAIAPGTGRERRLEGGRVRTEEPRDRPGQQQNSRLQGRGYRRGPRPFIFQP